MGKSKFIFTLFQDTQKEKKIQIDKTKQKELSELLMGGKQFWKKCLSDICAKDRIDFRSPSLESWYIMLNLSFYWFSCKIICMKISRFFFSLMIVDPIDYIDSLNCLFVEWMNIKLIRDKNNILLDPFLGLHSF